MNEQEQQQNNQCLDIGVLVSLHDGELPAGERERALAHIATCAGCAADHRASSASRRDVYDLLSISGPRENEIPSTVTAFAAMQARLDAEGLRKDRRSAGALSLLKPGSSSPPIYRGGPLRFVRHRRAAWLAATVAAALIALLLLPNAAALANQFLALFQVQQFQPVDINPRDFSRALLLDITKYGDINQQGFDTGLQPMSEDQVKQLLRFPLLLPTHLPPGVGSTAQFAVNTGGMVTFVFRAAKARAYLEANGEHGVSIPAQLDGATYKITIQTSVLVSYVKSCPPGAGIDTVNQCSGTPFFIAEISNPVVQGVGNASLKDLRDFFISLPNQSSQMRSLLQNIDLNTGTVPLPIPPQVNAQQVTAHGAPGVLLTDNSLGVGAVLWQTGGVIYIVAGMTGNTSGLMDAANSLQR